MSDDEIYNLDITNVPDDNPTGYILEVDLEYPRDLHELHELHNDNPLAPEKVTLTEEMLSPYSKSFPGKHVLTEKLIPNLNDKTKIFSRQTCSNRKTDSQFKRQDQICYILH